MLAAKHVAPDSGIRLLARVCGDLYDAWRKAAIQMIRSLWRTAPQWAALALALVVALAGCATQAAAPTASPSPTPTNDVVNIGASSPSPTATFVVIAGTPGAYGPACQAKQLALTFAIDESSTGTSTQMGTVTNHSTTACSLFGFPGAELFDAQHAPIAVQVFQATSGVWSGVFPEQHIQLAPGASAYFATAWSTASTGAQISCFTSSYFALTPPGETSAVTGADTIHVCDTITVSPFQNAPFMGS